MSGGGRCRRARKPITSTPAEAKPAPYFDTSFGIRELVALTDQDFQELDALAGEAEGTALWWHLRRLEWAEEDGADGR